MAATGDLNPGWFGHPASTLMYPAALSFHIWYALTHGGRWLQPNPGLLSAFATTPGSFYLIGRVLTTVYALATIPLVYLVGRRAFPVQVALIGAWLAWLAPVALENAQMVRSDSAGACFGLLSLLMCLRLYERPSAANQLLAGAAIGLAVATRYFMVVLIPVLVAVDLLVVWRGVPRRAALGHHWPGMALGLLMVPVAFCVATPFFLLDYHTAWQSLKHEARSQNLGADGFSRPGNLLWYLTSAIPASITWPRYLLALVGIGLALRRRRLEQLLLALFVAVFLGTISLSRLHWQRWIIQVLPVLALFTAAALYELTARASRGLRAHPRAWFGALAVLCLLLAAPSLIQLVQETQERSRYSTRIAAREWIMEHVPPGSQIALEWDTAPLTLANFERYGWERHTAPEDGQGFTLYAHRTLATRTLEEYQREGFEYLVVSDAIYGRYVAEAERYPDEVAFYDSLFRRGHLVGQFEPGGGRGGPTIRIYSIAPIREMAVRVDVEHELAGLVQEPVELSVGERCDLLRQARVPLGRYPRSRTLSWPRRRPTNDCTLRIATRAPST
jgi:hypothetical protein